MKQNVQIGVQGFAPDEHGFLTSPVKAFQDGASFMSLPVRTTRDGVVVITPSDKLSGTHTRVSELTHVELGQLYPKAALRLGDVAQHMLGLNPGFRPYVALAEDDPVSPLQAFIALREKGVATHAVRFVSRALPQLAILAGVSPDIRVGLAFKAPRDNGYDVDFSFNKIAAAQDRLGHQLEAVHLPHGSLTELGAVVIAQAGARISLFDPPQGQRTPHDICRDTRSALLLAGNAGAALEMGVGRVHEQQRMLQRFGYARQALL